MLPSSLPLSSSCLPVKAICVPSGDQAGTRLNAQYGVRRRRPVPFSLTTKIASHPGEAVSGSQLVFTPLKAISLPFGDHDGSPTWRVPVASVLAPVSSGLITMRACRESAVLFLLGVEVQDRHVLRE